MCSAPNFHWSYLIVLQTKTYTIWERNCNKPIRCSMCRFVCVCVCVCVCLSLLERAPSSGLGWLDTVSKYNNLPKTITWFQDPTRSPSWRCLWGERKLTFVFASEQGRWLVEWRVQLLLTRVRVRRCLCVCQDRSVCCSAEECAAFPLFKC